MNIKFLSFCRGKHITLFKRMCKLPFLSKLYSAEEWEKNDNMGILWSKWESVSILIKLYTWFGKCWPHLFKNCLYVGEKGILLSAGGLRVTRGGRACNLLMQGGCHENVVWVEGEWIVPLQPRVGRSRFWQLWGCIFREWCFARRRQCFVQEVI